MIKIGGVEIGVGRMPFVIAEMSSNHNQSLERALAIVTAAAEAGAHAVKLQTYSADTMTIDVKEGEFLINDPDSLWFGYSLYELYEVAHTPWEWHKPILDHCRDLGIICFSTPFDDTAVAFLEELDVPCYKIASFELVDHSLIKRVAATGKPIIMSTGMASLAEIDDAVRVIRDEGDNDIILLKCTSTYPASPVDSNLLTLPHMRQMFECEVGLSDHTLGVGVALASVALGATVIEKHLTLSRDDGGVDAAFSIEPRELSLLVLEARRASQSLGRINYSPTRKEEKSLRFRRSLYVVKDICKGEVLTEDHIRAIRPGRGLAPKFYADLVGKHVRKDLVQGTPLTWDLIL